MDQFFNQLATTFANLETPNDKKEFCANLFNAWHELATKTVEALFSENENAQDRASGDKELEELEFQEFMIGKMEEGLRGVEVVATNSNLAENW